MLGSRSGEVRDKVEHVGCAVEAVESPAHNSFKAAPTPQRKRPDQIDQARPRGALSRCGAAARVRAVLPSGAELLFCQHHANEHEAKLVELAAVIEVSPLES